MSKNNDAVAIRTAVVGAIIAEYGAMQAKGIEMELRQRIKKVIESSRNLQRYFVIHPKASEKDKQVFKKEFLKSEIVLIAAIVEKLWDLGEDDLDLILETITNAINNEKEKAPVTGG